MFGRHAYLYRLFAVSGAVMALVMSMVPPVLAEETAVEGSASVALSERRAAEAFQAYTKKDYALAVALYLDAYEAAPSGSILYNIALIYDMKLGDRPLAITFYRRYIADPGAHAELIEAANLRLGELREAEHAASQGTEEGSISDADTRQRARGSPHTVLDNSHERRGWSTLRWIGVALGAVGLAGVGVGGGFGLAAISKAGTAHDSCSGNSCTSQSGVDAAHAARADARISNIGIGAGGALLLTGVALFFFGADKAPEQRSHADIRLETRTTASALSLQVSGRW